MSLQNTQIVSLLQFVIRTYFAKLSTVAIVYASKAPTQLEQQYLDAVVQSFRNQSVNGNIIGLQWIDVDALNADIKNEIGIEEENDADGRDDNTTAFDQQLLQMVDMVATEGFITILTNTRKFFKARYYATRQSELRLKDKYYLFLCEHEHPKDLLSDELLQYYPHHLMVTPSMSVTLRPQKPSVRTMEVVLSPESDSERKSESESESELKQEVKQTTQIKGTLNKFIANIDNPLSEISSNETKDHPLSDESWQSGVADASNHRYNRRRTDINFELWTQKFVGAGGNLDAVLLDVFLPGKTFAKNVELYPNKLLNMDGRSVRVGSITYIPYVVTNYVAAGAGSADSINSNNSDRSVSYVGSEAELVKTFCRVRNCRLLVEPYGADNWGIILDNGTSSGMLGDIYTGQVEMAIGCVYNWYNDLTETSMIIARSAVTFIGPTPSAFPAWRTNTIPFNAIIWSLVLSTMGVCTIAWYLLKLSRFTLKQSKGNNSSKFRHIDAMEESAIQIFAIFIQQASASTGVNSFAKRFLLASLLLSTIILENTYSGQLKSILTIPLYSEPVDTTDKFSLTDWKWAAPAIAWVQTIEESHLPKEQILAEKFETRDYDFLYNASFRMDYGLGVERLLSGSFSFGHFITPLALETKLVLKDDLFFDWTRAVSIRGWPLMPLFDEHILACMETGLFIHWERKMVAEYLDPQTQAIMMNLASGYKPKMPPKKLTVINISGAIFALLIGYCIATVVFLLECFGHIPHLSKNF